MKNTMLQFRKKCGESLVEVIIAIFVVSVGSGVATTLIVSALQANEFSRDNLIALNLAVEGLESMRGIRDANWLKFSYDKNGCWNMRPDALKCEADKSIANGNYTVDLNFLPNKYSWDLTKKDGQPLDLSGGVNSPYQLSYYDIDLAVNSDGKGGIADDRDVLASNPDGVSGLATSPFYRMISIKTVAEDMDVASTVQWLSQGLKHEVVLTSKLTNYQKDKTE